MIGGFTIIELIAVIVVLAILAGAAVPAISNLQQTRSVAAARYALGDLTFARSRAIATGISTWVVFDVSDARWTILTEQFDQPGRVSAVPLTDAATGGPYATALGKAPFEGVTLIDADFDGGAELGFDWNGRPLNSSENLLQLPGVITLSGGHVIRVEIETGLSIHDQP